MSLQFDRSNPLAFETPSNAILTARLPAPKTRVVVVRHGRSTYNEQGRYQGSSDEAVLTENGRATARQVGMSLKGVSVDVVYTSPLQRARETVREILTAMGTAANEIPVRTCESLREIDLPAWQGRFFQEVRKQFADDYRCWKQRPHEFQMPVRTDAFPEDTSGSSETVSIDRDICFPVVELYERVQRFWQDVLPRHSGQTLLVVGHGGTNHALVSTAIGLPPACHHRLQQSNCGVSVLDFSRGSLRLAQLQALNLTTPFGEMLPKLKEGKQGLRMLLVPSDGMQSDRIRLLAECFRSTSIDFGICDDRADSQSIAAELQIDRANGIRFQGFPKKTLQASPKILATQNHRSTSLVTGLAIAHSSAIKRLLGEAIDLPATQLWRLDLQPGTFSTLHYPSIEHPPILQALNIAPNQRLAGF
ncbi:MAG: histidine phosphatase family protein [Cyanobacteria bacterium SID2]|nr:histidine phosphatase family protein [Cyanobacteria bacterium SID2]MBP0005709.1 histidine phosphatase family protein [Cyanobacteria bacterium SBC]